MAIDDESGNPGNDFCYDPDATIAPTSEPTTPTTPTTAEPTAEPITGLYISI